MILLDNSSDVPMIVFLFDSLIMFCFFFPCVFLRQPCSEVEIGGTDERFLVL